MEQIFTCDCCDLDHQFQLSYDEENKELLVNTSNSPLPLLYRLRAALRYVLNNKPGYNYGTCVILSGKKLDDFLVYTQKISSKQ